jgi:hypothetical protein
MGLGVERVHHVGAIDSDDIEAFLSLYGDVLVAHINLPRSRQRWRNHPAVSDAPLNQVKKSRDIL